MYTKCDRRQNIFPCYYFYYLPWNAIFVDDKDGQIVCKKNNYIIIVMQSLKNQWSVLYLIHLVSLNHLVTDAQKVRKKVKFAVTLPVFEFETWAVKLKKIVQRKVTHFWLSPVLILSITTDDMCSNLDQDVVYNIIW